MSPRGFARALIPWILAAVLAGPLPARAAGARSRGGGHSGIRAAVVDWEAARDAWEAERAGFESARYRALDFEARVRRTAPGAEKPAAVVKPVPVVKTAPVVKPAAGAKPAPVVKSSPDAKPAAAKPAPAAGPGDGGKPAWMVQSARRLENQAGAWLDDDKPAAPKAKAAPKAADHPKPPAKAKVKAKTPRSNQVADPDTDKARKSLGDQDF